MKMTGDDELDFIREAGSEVLNFGLKGYLKFLVAEVIALGIFGGLVALLSMTVALWIFVICGGLLLLQALFVAFAQYRARRFLKKSTVSTDALDKVTEEFYKM